MTADSAPNRPELVDRAITYRANDAWNAARYARHSSLQEAMAAKLLARIDLRGNERILDIGCGNGRLSASLASNRVPRGSVLGIDSSADMVAFARRHHPGIGNLDFAVADARRLAFDQAFDVVVSFNALHWLASLAPAMRGICSALRPNGRAWLRLVTRGPVTSLEEVAEQVRRSPPWAHLFAGFEDPYLHASAEQVAAVAKDEGLHVCSADTRLEVWDFGSRGAFLGFCRAGFGAWTGALPVEHRQSFIEAVHTRYTEMHGGGESTFRFYQTDLLLERPTWPARPTAGADPAGTGCTVASNSGPLGAAAVDAGARQSRAGRASSRALTTARTMSICIAATMCLGACGGNDAQTPTFSDQTVQQLDAAVEAEMRSGNLPSVAVGIWVPGDGSYVQAKGATQLGGSTPRTTADPFRIASITKTFTGTAVLMLADDGRLRLTDKLSTWYPNFPRAAEITVTDLLRMRSGIPDSMGEGFVTEYYANPLTTLGAEAMIARAAVLPLSQFSAPDTTTVYTNVNFALLERIVEKTSGQDIRSFLKARIFDPLAMAHTVYPSGPTLDSPLHGYSYEPVNGRFADRTLLNPAPAGGAGAIVSTLDDLHGYARKLCAGGLLRPETQSRRLVTTAFQGGPALVGYGEAVARIGRFCGHNGTIFGFSSEMWYLPEKDAVIVINVNRLDADDQSRSFELFARLTKIVFPTLVDW